MATVPKTQVEVKLIPAPGGEAPLYHKATDDKPFLPLASVNAGNSQLLYLGGKGINNGFDLTLTAAHQTTSQYQSLHQALFTKAQADPTGAAFEQYPSADPMVFSFCRSNLLTPAKAGWYEGTCFVDIFDAAHRPGGIAENVAMLYAAPPHGAHYPKSATFLNAIIETAASIIATVAAYNAIAAQHNQPPIEALRLCAFSSGIYNPHDVSLNKVARAIFAGITRGLQAETTGLKEIHLPIQAPLFYAIKDDLAIAAANAASAAAAAPPK